MEARFLYKERKMNKQVKLSTKLYAGFGVIMLLVVAVTVCPSGR